MSLNGTITENPRKFHLHDAKKGTAIVVRVIPHAHSNLVCELQNEGIVLINLAAPQVDGKTNLLLVEYLAEIMDLPQEDIEIIAGTGGRDKLVTLLGLDADTVQRRLVQMNAQ